MVRCEWICRNRVGERGTLAPPPAVTLFLTASAAKLWFTTLAQHFQTRTTDYIIKNSSVFRSCLSGGGGAATTPTQGHRGALIKANDVTVLMTMLTSFYVGGVSITVKRLMRRVYVNSIMILHLLSNLFYSSSILANINNQTIIILLSAPNLNLQTNIHVLCGNRIQSEMWDFCLPCRMFSPKTKTLKTLPLLQ